jgi:unsaturated chondroitin disaccharide hydrolase
MQRLALFSFVAIAFLPSKARAQALDSLPGIASDLSFIETQVGATLTSLGSPTSGYPTYGGNTGTWTTTIPSDGALGWTSGFFPGELWLLYQATGSKTWLNAANTWTAPLLPYTSPDVPPGSSTLRVDPTDIGFIIGTSVGNGYRLTGSTTYKTALLDTGTSLSSLYSPTVGAVRSWKSGFDSTHYGVIIDSMMTLGPLQWGATHGGMSSWATDATTHAETVTTNLVRTTPTTPASAFGSTFEVADFNPTTGALLSQTTFAGFSNSSTWARGEAWALYGFVQAYQTSDNPAFLATAEDIANYFVGQLELDGSWVPPWDFDATDPKTQPVDTSAVGKRRRRLPLRRREHPRDA